MLDLRGLSTNAAIAHDDQGTNTMGLFGNLFRGSEEKKAHLARVNRCLSLTIEIPAEHREREMEMVMLLVGLAQSEPSPAAAEEPSWEALCAAAELQLEGKWRTALVLAGERDSFDGWESPWRSHFDDPRTKARIRELAKIIAEDRAAGFEPF